MNDGRRTGRHRRRIQHQHRRRVEPQRDFRGRPGQRRRTFAVEQSHDSFDDGHVGILDTARENLQVRFSRQHPAVQIAARSTRGRLMESRIDKVGADFEPLHAKTAPMKRSHDSSCNGGLASAAVRSADDDDSSRHTAPNGWRHSRLKLQEQTVLTASPGRGAVPGMSRDQRERLHVRHIFFIIEMFAPQASERAHFEPNIRTQEERVIREMRMGSSRPAFARSMAHTPEAGLLTCRSSLNRLAFPFRRTVAYCAGRSLLTVAGPCGIFTRFPFHSPLTTSTSGSSQASIRSKSGQSKMQLQVDPGPSRSARSEKCRALQRIISSFRTGCVRRERPKNQRSTVG